MTDSRPRHWLDPDTAAGLSGWAIDPAQPERPVSLSVSVAGRTVAAFAAARRRGDVQKLYGGEGRHGFLNLLPLSLYDGVAKPLRVERVDTGEVLIDAVAPFADLRWGGTVSGLMRAARFGLEGWVVDQADLTRACAVEIWMDGRRLYEIVAEKVDPSLPYPDGPARRHGFAVAWPAEAFDGKTHRFEARLPGGAAAAEVSVKPPASSRLTWTGELTIRDGGVHGALTAQGAGSMTAPLDLFSADRRVGRCWARSGQTVAGALLEGVSDAVVRGALSASIGGVPVALQGADPFDAWLTVTGAEAVDDGLSITLAAPVEVYHGVEVAVVVDGVEIEQRRLEVSGGHANLAVKPPAGWRRLALRLADGADQAVLRTDAGAEATDAGPWIAPDDRLAIQARALAEAGLRLEDVLGWTGDWRLEASMGRVEGWALDLARPDRAVEVVLLVDGAAVKTLSAKGPFAFDLGEIAVREPFSEIGVRIGDATPGPIPIERYSRGGLGWEVTEAVWRDFRLSLSGWALDFSAPERSLSVELLLDGAVAASVTSRPGDAGAFDLIGLTGPENLDARARLRVDGGAPRPLPSVERVRSVATVEAAALGPDDLYLGRLERIDETVAQGWIVNVSHPETPPRPQLWLDDARVGADPVILPIERDPPAVGARQFAFILPPGLSQDQRARLEVRPSQGLPALEVADDRLAPVGEVVGGEIDLTATPARATGQPSVAALVFSRDGGAALRRLFETVIEHEAIGPVWVVLDTRQDPSVEDACRDAHAAGLKVLRIAAPAHRLEAAVTEAVEASGASTLVLMGDDARLCGPLLDPLAAALETPGAGLTGCVVRPSTVTGRRGSGSVGRRLVPLARPGPRHVYALADVPSADDSSAQWLAAPSDGPVAVRTADLLAVGGLIAPVPATNPWGDLALRLNRDLNRGVLGVSSPVEMTETAPDGDAGQRTGGWDGALRQALRDDLASVGRWTGARPVVGLLMDDDDPDQAGRARTLSAAVKDFGPVRVVRLSAAHWDDLGGIDLAVALSGLFRPGVVRSLRPHLRLVRWLGRDETLTDGREWDAVWTDSSDQADALNQDQKGLGARCFEPAAACDLLRSEGGLKIAIKTSARWRDEAHWGDFHFAVSLSEALAEQGHRVRVDARDAWHMPRAAADDLVVVLRGLARYQPSEHQTNLLWIISHPEAAPLGELAAYDRTFVASVPYADTLAALTGQPVEPLLQCTDSRRFHFDVDTAGMPRDAVVFVGNSRGVFRHSVRWALEAGVDLALYGKGWEAMTPHGMVRAEYVPNALLAGLYQASGLVLCDHWDDMARLGFISNRVFDALAAGAVLATDAVDGLDIAFGPFAPIVVTSADDLKAAVASASEHSADRRAASEWVLEHHTFAHRAGRLAEAARAIRGEWSPLRAPGPG